MEKIYYIANIRLPTEKAHGVAIMKMCEAFADQGEEVTLVVPKRRTPIKEDPFEFYVTRKNFEIKKLWCLDWIRLGRFGFWAESWSFAKMAALLAIRKKGIFYTRDELIAFVLKSLGKKVVWESHMGQTNFFIRRIIKMNVPFVAISQGLKDLYLSLGKPSRKIMVAPSGIDLKPYEEIKESKDELRKRLNLPLDKKLIIYTGSKESWKGSNILEEAERYFPKDCELIWIWGKKHSEIPFYQKAADILILPNTSKTKIASLYTSPLKLFEYMASGTPILAANLPSIREIVDESQANFFNPDDPRDLARAIIGSLEDAEAPNKSARALDKVQRYTWQKRAKEVLNFIE